MKQFFNTNSFVANGSSSIGKTIHEQSSTKVEQIRDTLQNQHLGPPAQKVVNLNDPPTNSNKVKRVPATTTIPPSSMAAIQQTMVYANAIPIPPPSLTPPHSPFDARYGAYTTNRRQLYAQPPYVNTTGNMPAYSANYRPPNQYTMPMMNMLHPQRQVLLPAQPGIAQPGFTHNVFNTLPYTALPTHSTAGQYYHTNVAQPWPNVAYTNYPIAMQQERATSAPPSPTREHQPKGCAGMPKSRSFPDSTALHALITQANMDNKTFYPPQYYSEPKNEAKTSAPAPTATKPLLPEATPTPCKSTKRKPIEYLAGKLTASGKQFKMMSSAIQLEKILKYRPNMARHRPKKEETAEQQLAREKNTIACRKYRRMRRIAKILEQEMVEAESASHIADIL
ncbi:bromodomain-containing protein 4A isoform X2 [Bactrocera dorsalis]|uniref:Bromodomain-containing protein 4A isoform X2 n=2 Tax=Bactrocera dorsalis TaxID=27457 RepID=A0ABM3K0E7_BACDO|nr:bromodomain-containing protein 4A isoform X2 [Bactrocera dorsalis]